MGLYTKEACQDAFAKAKVYTLSSGPKGLTLADMEAIFGRLARTDAISGGERNTMILESEDQERMRVFNFTENALTKVSQDGIRTLIPCRDPSVFTPFILPTRSSSNNFNTEAWWTALVKTQDNSQDLLNKIIIVQSRFFVGASMHEVHQQLKHSRIGDQEKQTLLNSLSFSAYYCGKRIVAIYAMFMYVLDIEDFKGFSHLHERTTGVFLSLSSPHNAPAHPHDVSNLVADNRAAALAEIERPSVWITHRLVYHNHKPRHRYLNDAGSVIELTPVRDTTTQVGYYKTVVHALQSDGTPGTIERIFIEQSKLCEDQGFYYSADAARENLSRASSEKLALALQTSRDTLYKAWITSLQAETKAASQTAKEQVQASQQTIKDALDKNTENYRSQADSMIKENQQLHEKLKAAREEACDVKRTHDKDMIVRREQLELLKLIPAMIAVVTAVVAIGKSSKKK